MDSVRPAEASSSTFELITLGSPSLRDQMGQVPVGLGSGKPLALLCFLTIRGEVRRDEALALLWDDVDEDRARNAFRQALHRLRIALGEDVVAGDRQVLRIAPGAGVRSDVAAFEKAIEEGRFDDAVALYRGNFLDGLDVGSRAFDEWADSERARLRSRCQIAAERAAQRALVDGRMEDAARALRKLEEVAPSDPRAIEVAATGLISMGRRDDAADVLGAFARRAAAEATPVPRSLQQLQERLTPSGPAPVVAEQSRTPAFVGRTSELARLLAIWRSVGEESGATVVIEGPTGVGKSRLLDEFADNIRALGNAHVLVAIEAPRELSAPYAAVATALRPLVRAPGVAGASPHLLAEAARLLPELRDSLQLPALEPLQEETLQEETARLRVCEGVAALLESAAYERAICLVIEDVHRASQSTLEMLSYLASRLRRTRVAIVLSFDANDIADQAAARLRALAGAPGADEESHCIALGPLAGAPQFSATRPIAPQSFAAMLQRQFPNWRFLLGGALASTAIAIAVTALRPAPTPTPVRTRDTLVVMRADEQRGLVRFVTAPREGGLARSDARPRDPATPSWADSLDVPWVNAQPSPTGEFVGLERVSPTGSNVLLVAADRRDTIALVTGDVEGLGMGWSPDGSMFLATRAARAGADHRVSLYAFPAGHSRPAVPIDTMSNHAVTEAAWSPTGTNIAWVARVQGGNEEVFVSWVDGSNRRNVSAHPAQDYHLAWSADGSLLAFTSRRDGNAELYAFDLLGDRLWRLTSNDAQDDRAFFDRDGRFVAFESSRGGASDVYVMPSLGGDPLRVGDSTSSFEIVGWRPSERRYLDRLEIEASTIERPGDTTLIRIRGVDPFAAPVGIWQALWTIVDRDLLDAVEPDVRDEASERRFVGKRDGLARVVVNVGAWRSDTAYIRVGTGQVALLRDDFNGAVAAAWRTLGSPRPDIGAIGSETSALRLNADRQGESGVLSIANIPLQAGLSVEAGLLAPLDQTAAATTATVALVAPATGHLFDAAAPRVSPRISISWKPSAGRFVYAVDRDVFEEAIPAGAAADARALRMTVNADGTVTFFVDGAARWTSTLRVLRGDRASSAKVWLGGQDTGPSVGFGSVSVTLGARR